MTNETIILYGFLASLAAGLMTGVGAIPTLFIKKISQRFEDTSESLFKKTYINQFFNKLI